MTTATRPRGRPLSPHLSIWKWGPHMLVSILHRACGVTMATVGVLVFVWWLAALAAGPDAYTTFHSWIVANDSRPPPPPTAPSDGTFHSVVFVGDGPVIRTVNLLARIVAIGLTWTLFQHLANGVRHFVMDLGAGYELRANKTGAMVTMLFAVAATALLWAYILVGRG